MPVARRVSVADLAKQANLGRSGWSVCVYDMPPLVDVALLKHDLPSGRRMDLLLPAAIDADEATDVMLVLSHLAVLLCSVRDEAKHDGKSETHASVLWQRERGRFLARARATLGLVRAIRMQVETQRGLLRALVPEIRVDEPSTHRLLEFMLIHRALHEREFARRIRKADRPEPLKR